MLQYGDDKRINLYQTRTLFDRLLADFPDDNDRLDALKPSFDIVNNPDFENGTEKVQGSLEQRMTAREKFACKIFLKSDENDESDEDDTEESVGYAESIIENANRRKRSRTDASKYISTEHVLKDSNICERLFSRANLIMSSLRKKMKPETLNILLFLHANRKYWPDARIIQNI